MDNRPNLVAVLFVIILVGWIALLNYEARVQAKIDWLNTLPCVKFDELTRTLRPCVINK